MSDAATGAGAGVAPGGAGALTADAFLAFSGLGGSGTKASSMERVRCVRLIGPGATAATAAGAEVEAEAWLVSTPGSARPAAQLWQMQAQRMQQLHH